MKHLLALFVFTSSLFAEINLPIPFEHKPSEIQAEIESFTGTRPVANLRQGIVGKCLSGENIPNSVIEKYLLENFNVKVVNQPLPADKDLLIYLAAYFEIMGIRFKKPLEVGVSPEEGPQLVKVVGNRLVFTRDASTDVFVKKLKDAIINAPKNNPLVEVDFSNTLFEQLTEKVLTRDVLGKFFLSHYGFDITPKVSPSDERFARHFNNKEATMLMKQFVDLPVDITRSLKLKGIVRMQGGYRDGQNAQGDYNEKTQIIRLYDQAFVNGQVLGEGTILHELGHAFWYGGVPEGLQVRFIDLSWEKSLTGEYSPKNAKSNFVSEYARKNPKEDFAEAFSAYLNRPEWLKKVAPDKFQFFKDNFFPGTEYYSKAHPKASIYIDSKDPDTEPPYFKGNLKDLVTITAKLLKESNQVEVTCTVDGLFDDKSGILSVQSCLKSDNYKNPSIYFFWMKCTDAKKGQYSASKTIPLSDFLPKSTYTVSYVDAKDNAGNEKSYTVAGGPTINIDGQHTDLRERTKDPAIDQLEKYNITPLPAIPGKEQSYLLETPIKCSEDIQLISLYWNFGENYIFDISHSFYSNDVCTKEEIEKQSPIKLKFVFPKEMTNKEVRLSGVRVSYRKTEKYEDKHFDINFPKDIERVRIKLNPSKPDYTLPQIMPNDLDLDVKKQTNTRGGDTSIKVRIAIKDLPKDGAIRATFRTPSGKEIYDLIRIKDIKTLENNGDIKMVEVEIPFLPNHEKGIYTLETIRLRKDYPTTEGAPGAKGIHGFDQVTEFKFLERGIKKTIEVRP